MDINIEVRKRQLESLDHLVSSSKKRLHSVLSNIGWSAEATLNVEDSLLGCPVDRRHRIPSKSWNGHVQKCVIKREGYDVKEQFLSESLSDPSQSIYLDCNLKREIISKALNEQEGKMRLAWNGLGPDPRTADRFVSTYSPEERLAFYMYSVENTSAPPEPPEFMTIIDKKASDDQKLSVEEMLALQRNAKRRRTKYRSVHTNRKNHTEVIKEVIDGQMEEYKDWLLSNEEKERLPVKEDCNSNTELTIITDCKEKIEDQERPNSSISRNSSHSNNSRSTHKRYERSRDRRDRSRNRSEKRSTDRRRNRSSERRYRVSPHRPSRHKSRRSKEHSSERKRSSREGSRVKSRIEDHRRK